MAKSQGKNTKALVLQFLYVPSHFITVFIVRWETNLTALYISACICLFNARICPFIRMGKGNPQQTLKQGS